MSTTETTNKNQEALQLLQELEAPKKAQTWHVNCHLRYVVGGKCFDRQLPSFVLPKESGILTPEAAVSAVKALLAPRNEGLIKGSVSAEGRGYARFTI